MDSIIEQKKQLRKEIREKKRVLTKLQKETEAKNVFQQIEKLQEFINAQEIMVYWSMDDELPTHQFINKWHKKKNLYLPGMKDGKIVIRQFQGEDKMIAGEDYNIPEPSTPIQESDNHLQLIIIPGMAFDSHGNRMGRGGGFYDRFLQNPDLYKIGVGFSVQYYQNIPLESHDIQLNINIIGMSDKL